MVSTPSVLFIQLQGKETGYFQTLKSERLNLLSTVRVLWEDAMYSLTDSPWPRTDLAVVWAERFAAHTEGNEYHYRYYYLCQYCPYGFCTIAALASATTSVTTAA